MNAPIRNKRLTFEHWTVIGLNALGDPAIPDMTMEVICSYAGKTRGSFYAHFSGMDEFLTAVAEAWERAFTDRLIAETTSALPSRNRLDRLNYLAMRLDHATEQAIRRLAVRDANVGTIVQRVDRKRTDYLARLYRDSGRYDDKDALALARIEYAAFVGMQLTEQKMSPAERRGLYDSFLRLTGRIAGRVDDSHPRRN